MRVFSVTLVVVLFLYNLFELVDARGKYKKGNEIEDEFYPENSTHEENRMTERGLRREASVIVLVIFLIVTFGMFFCCRHIPELVMEKCNIC